MAINRDKVLASAIKLLQAGKYEKAIAEFQKLVDDDPKDVRTILKIGDTYVKIGNRQEAIRNYERVANIYSEQGFYLKAVAVFKQMLRVDSNLPDVHLKLAEMYQQLGLVSDCLQHYQQVAVFYEQQGKGKDTLQILKRMVDLDPDNLPSRIKLAELFAQQGMNEDAVSEFESAATYLKEQERFDDFIRVAERLIYFDPSAIQITRELSDLYLKRGEPKLALGKLQVCFKADPRNLETLTLIAQAFLEMKQIPKTISVYKEMARIHEGAARTEEAARHWRNVLELDGDDAEARQALDGAARPEASAPSPEPAPADAESEQIGRLLTETDVYVKYGLKDKAVEHLRKILGLKPEHLDARDKLRAIYQSMGNRDGVLSELRTLVRLGEQGGDARLESWRQDLETLSAAPAPGPMAFARPSAADEADEVVEVDEADEILLVEDQEELLDPDLADEPSLLSEEGADLPPDEVALDEAFPDDAMVGMASAEADIIADEPMVGVSEIEAEARDEPPSSVPAPIEDLAAEGDFALSDADALVQEALRGMEGLDDGELDFIDDELSLVDDSASLELPSATGDAELLAENEAGEDEDISAVAAKAVAEMGDDGDAPEGFDLGDGAPLDDEVGATAVMSLSVDEMDEINRFIAQEAKLAAEEEEAELEKQGASPPAAAEEEQPEEGVDYAEAARGFDDDFSGATLMAEEGAEHDRTAAPSQSAEGAAFATETGGEPAFDDEMDLDELAAAAAAGLDAFAMGGDEDVAEAGGDDVPMPPADDEARGPRLGVSEQAYGFEDDPAAQFFAEEIEEAEFFIQQELLDEAREILDEILEDVPESARARWMLARLNAKENDEPEPPPPWAERIIGEVAEEVGDLFDGEESPPDDSSAQVSALEVLSAFKKGVKEAVSDDDADTHYNLGIAYREMGLLDDAIGEFRMAAKAEARRPDCLHLIGLTLIDQGNLDEALATFQEVLALPAANQEQRGVAEYESGVCYESLEQADEALGALERARALGAQMGDLESRIARLTSAGANGKSHNDGDAVFSSDEGGSRRKNIDYV